MCDYLPADQPHWNGPIKFPEAVGERDKWPEQFGHSTNVVTFPAGAMKTTSRPSVAVAGSRPGSGLGTEFQPDCSDEADKRAFVICSAINNYPE